MSRRLRRTKIVTTLGPATDRDNNLEKIIAAGANVVAFAAAVLPAWAKRGKGKPHDYAPPRSGR